MYEVIEFLCSIVEQQSKFIKQMCEAIMMTDLPEELKGDIAAQQNKIEEDIDVAEYKLRLR